MEMASTLASLAIVLAVMTLNLGIVQSQSAEERLAEERKCINVVPSDQCNLEVTYGQPVGTVQCDQKVPESDGQVLTQPPLLKVSSTIGEILVGILLMFDPDAPVSNLAMDGFIHWIAQVSVDKTGQVTIEKDFIDYFPPTPPKGRGEHRYQFFLFRHDSEDPLVFNKSRKFVLCPFLSLNRLGQPVAASQFKFERQ